MGDTLSSVVSAHPTGSALRGAIAVFRKAGFSSKAVIIEGLVKDLHGRSTDVVIMVCDVGTQYG